MDNMLGSVYPSSPDHEADGMTRDEERTKIDTDHGTLDLAIGRLEASEGRGVRLAQER
jgi:hypothetical protein